MEKCNLSSYFSYGLHDDDYNVFFLWSPRRWQGVTTWRGPGRAAVLPREGRDDEPKEEAHADTDGQGLPRENNNKLGYTTMG